MKVTSSSSSGTSSDDEEDSDDATSTAGTETTETTLIDRNESELQEQIESLKLELETAKSRCDRLEREKSDLLLRRIASIDMPSSRMSSAEANRLQQKINELTTQLEDMRDDKKSLSLRVKELEQEMDSRPDKAATQRAMDDLRSKLLAAETLCEELMDENEDMKRELRDLEEEIEEMQDNFREDQADEYTSLKKELEQTTKNCRILSFKLRKAERKTESLEAEKLELEGKCRQIAGGQTGLEKIEKITKLEHDLSVANEVASRLQKELDETKEKLKEKEEAASKVEATVTKKKAPKLADMSGHLRVSRESLTRGGSQEDPAQLLRDLQDAMEREADLREQLRFAEEEAQTLRKKTARMEDDNESLVLQLKKMATKARSRIKSPSPARMTPEPATEKDEGIAEEDDPAELRLQLELNEQEAAVLRRKVDELEKEGDTLKKKVKDLQDKLNAKPAKKLTASSIVTPEPGKGNAVYEQKIKVLEEELSECRMKLIEKERDVERLHAELTLTQKRSKGSIQKSKSLDSGNEQQALDLKRQLQVIEQEANILKSKNQALESENEKLSAENKRLVLLRGAKKPTGDNSTEMKEKVTALETELSEAKNKIKELESKEGSENKTDEKSGEKNTKENADEIKKLKGDLSKIESENQKLSETLKRLKDESCAAALKFYKQRTPKKPTDLTSKVQLKKMVEDLESEIGEVLVALKKSEMEKSKLKTSKTTGEDASLKETKEKLETAQKKVESLEKELKQEKEKSEKEKNKLTKEKKSAEEEKKKLEDLSKKLEEEKKNMETQGKKTEDSKKKIEDENKKLISEKDKLLEEKNKLEEQIAKLSAEKAAATAKQDEMTLFIQRVETLKKELEDEQKQGVELRKKLETAQKAEQEKIKLQKEVAEKSSKLADSDKKLKEIEEKLKKSERLLTSNKKKVVNLEKELTEEKERAKANESTQQGVAASWLAERDDLKQQIASLQSKVDSQEIALSGKTVLIEQLEANIKEERERVSDVSKKAGVAERQELNALKDELTTAKSRLQEITQTLEKVEANKKSSEVKFKKQENELKKERDDFEKKASELEMDLQAERKKIERMKITQEKESKNRETELATLRTKIRSLESNSNVSKKTAELQQEYESRIRKLEDELSGERQEYEDLTAKYEILEEEHVVTKAQLVMEKETLQSQLHSTKREMGSVENELRTLRETYNSKQDSWIKEKLDQQEKLKELEEKVSRSINNEALNIEKARSRAAIDEKNIEIEHLRREAEVLADQMNHIKRENDDLKKKMEDFNKVVKIQRNMTADTSALEKEVRDLKNKLFQEEKTHKSEMAQLKMRYDSQVAVVGEELQSLQGQVSRFKRERDTFRHMLEGAQKTIADLKASQPSRDSRPSSSASGEEAEDTLTKIATLEQQINCMEDELSEARLESSKLKTELVSERSSWEIKLSELQSRVNELEEERILTSGRTKIPGMRTRMELAWSKEREELQRLLQETSTLARDLRQTLFEVERERDKERLESKRRIDQLKKTTEEEVDENKKKVTELQCDLLELRDAHAKLRTTNEKLRREKERHEKEREELRQLASGKRRAEQDEERRINSLLDQVDELMRLAPELFQTKQASSDSGITTPTPPRRTKGPKSRESSPGLERKDYSRETSVDRKVQLQSTVQRLTEATDALRRYQKAGEEDRDRERARRALGMRRAASTESDNPPETTLRPLGASSRTSAQKGSLHRKALSLEQTSAQEQQSIWKTDDEGDGSLSSLQSVGSTDSRFYSLNRRDNSMDSRLSGGSTQSEFVSGEKKKKKGILGKLKQLTKSRSIDDTTTARDYMSSQGSLGGSGSDISMGGDEKGSKKDLRDRLTGMFKKPSSRANSVERGKKEPSPALPERMDSIQRPLVRNGSSSTLPRPSPARSDVSTSSVSRPLVPGKSSTPSSTTSTFRRVK